MTQMTFTKPTELADSTAHRDRCVIAGPCPQCAAELAAANRPPRPEVRAHLRQLDPAEGQRGWELWVLEWAWDSSRNDGRGAWVTDWETTPSTPLQKPGIRPPTLGQRLAALTRLGYEPAGPYEPVWEWQEAEWSQDRPYLFATLTVRRIGSEAAL